MEQRSPPRPRPATPDDGSAGPLQPRFDWALFLDIDGTLLHITDAPELAEVSDHLRAVLAALLPRFEGAIALISGRRLDSIDRLFAPLRLPAAGLHGLEHRGPNGDVRRLGAPEALNPWRDALAAFARDNPGVTLEDKGRAVALHYRRAPENAAAARHLVGQLMARHGSGLRVIDGKMVLEIKPALADKGHAVRGFLAEPPFRGRRPVFIGDDTTDEDAFAVVNALGGDSICVGDRPGTHARFRLADVDAVVAWLDAMPAALDRLEPRKHRR